MLAPLLTDLARRLARRAEADPDQVLLRRYSRDRDPVAFETLLARHAPLVLGVCRRILRHEHDAEDAFQATFLALAREAGRVGSAGSLAGWLHRVAFRIALKAKARRPRTVPAVGDPADPAPDAVAGAEVRAVIDAEVRRLPAPYRTAFVLCCLEGRTNREAARLLGCPTGTVDSRLAAARQRLRLRLTRRGLTLGAATLSAAGLADSRAAAQLLRRTADLAAGNTPVAPHLAALAAAGVPVARPGGLLLVVLLGLVGWLALAGPGHPPPPPAASPKVEPDREALWGVFRGPVGMVTTALAADSRRLATGLGGPAAPTAPAVQVWDLETGHRLAQLPRAVVGLGVADADEEAPGVAFTPDGRLAVTHRAGAGLYHPATGERLREFRPAGDRPLGHRLAVSPDGRTLAVTAGAEGRAVSLFDVATGQEVRTWEAHGAFIHDLAFAPDGKTLATGSPDQADLTAPLKLWDVATGRRVRAFVMPRRTWVYGLAFSPDGRTLASGHGHLASADHAVRLWDVASGALRAELTGCRDRVNAVAFRPDGGAVYAAGRDAAVRAWDVATGRPLGEARRFGLAPHLSLALSGDGRFLAAGGFDGAAAVWHLGGRPGPQAAGDDRPALVRAADAGRLTAVRALLAQGANPDQADAAGAPALCYAAAGGHAAVVTALLEAGASPHRPLPVQGKAAAALARRAGHAEVEAALAAYRAGCRPTALHASVAADDLGGLREALAGGVPVNARDAALRTPLYLAAQDGRANLVAELLRAGAHPDAADGADRTPLAVAVGAGDEATARALLAAGADADRADEDGNAPLHLAAAAGQRGLVAALLDHGARPDRANADGNAPAALALAAGQGPVVQLLVARGAQPPVPKNQQPFPPLNRDNRTVADLRAGNDPNQRFALFTPKATEKQPPKDGFKLLLVLPGGDGGPDFHTFIGGISAEATGNDYLVAQLVAPVWSAKQAETLVWPTKTNPWQGMKFPTEDFLAAVVAEVKQRHPLNEAKVFALGWSSGGPPVYAALMTEKHPVRGVFAAMSVFQLRFLPPPAGAKGKACYVYHSPTDFIKLPQAEQARDRLAQAGAKTTLATYQGGHGWHGDVFGDVRTGLTWLEENTPAPAKK